MYEKLLTLMLGMVLFFTTTNRAMNHADNGAAGVGVGAGCAGGAGEGLTPGLPVAKEKGEAVAGTPQDRLVNAILSSNLKGVKQAIKDKASVNFPTEDGFTPLIKAVNREPQGGAVKGDAVKIVAFLMEKNADINAAAPLGHITALMVAARLGYIPYVQELLKSKKLDTDKRSQKGMTALMFAADKEHVEVVKLLVKKGAHITLRDNEGKTARDYAQNEEIKKYLEQALDEQNIKKQGIWARLTGTASKNVLDAKPEAAVFVWARDKASPKNNNDTLRSLRDLLLDRYATPEKRIEAINFPGPYGYTALHYAVVNGDVLLAELLLDNGALPLIRDANGQTPLYQVLYHATATNEATTKTLLNLFRKALKGRFEEALKNAYALLPKSKQESILQNLPDREARLLRPFTKTAVFVWARDNSGKPRERAINLSELQKSITKYQGNKVELINFQGPYGYTALHYAVVNGDMPLVQLLLNNGASPLIRDANGQTTLYQVLYHATATNEVITETLLNLFRKALKGRFEEALKNAYALLPKSKQKGTLREKLDAAVRKSREEERSLEIANENREARAASDKMKSN